MKKKIIVSLIVLALCLACAVVYVNQVILPTKVKELLVKNLEDFTQKKVTLESLKFSIFKGLVLKGLKVQDEKNTLLSLKEGSCSFLIWPFFKKQLIITQIKLYSPVIFIERKFDSSLNIVELFVRNPAIKSKEKGDLNIIINKIIIRNAQVIFQDDTLSPSFKKEINSADLSISLSLPSKIKYNLQFFLAGQPTKVNSSGEYDIIKKTLKADISAKDLYPSVFSPYYRDSGFSIPQGKLDAESSIFLKDQILTADVSIKNLGLVISQENIKAGIDCEVKANLKYNLNDRQLSYSGNLNILDAGISGIATIKEINAIKGTVIFSNSGISADKLKASVLGFPLEVKASLADFKNPLLVMDIASDLDLKIVPPILKDKFNLAIPADIKGLGKLVLLIKIPLPLKGLPEIDGSLAISQGSVKLDKAEVLFNNMEGKLKFDFEKISWDGFKFTYLGQDYKSSGILSNFKALELKLALSSDNFSLDSYLMIKNKVIRLSKFLGRYLNSNFNITGDIDTSSLELIQANLKITSDIELEDLKLILKQQIAWLELIKPLGTLHCEANIIGNIADWKSCVIKSQFSSNTLSLYGLKLSDFSLNYNQGNGIADIPAAHMLLYDGTLNGSAKVNLQSVNLPYWVELVLEGLKIEKLKMDTPLKDKNIAGTIHTRVKLSGMASDFTKLSGMGKILITDGKLWELDLFQGLGALLFTHDFSKILFSQGSCNFTVQDKFVFTDNLSLKSNLCDIVGGVKIGFDSSLDASLNVQVNEDTPLSGTLRDVTTAIIGKSGRFGAIKISGTLQKPKYKFIPAYTDIIKSLTDTFLKKQH